MSIFEWLKCLFTGHKVKYLGRHAYPVNDSVSVKEETFYCERCLSGFVPANHSAQSMLSPELIACYLLKEGSR